MVPIRFRPFAHDTIKYKGPIQCVHIGSNPLWARRDHAQRSYHCVCHQIARVQRS